MNTDTHLRYPWMQPICASCGNSDKMIWHNKHRLDDPVTEDSSVAQIQGTDACPHCGATDDCMCFSEDLKRELAVTKKLLDATRKDVGKGLELADDWAAKCVKAEAEVERLRGVIRAEGEYTYTSKQSTCCAQCGERKHTPLRVDSMGGYVCLTCIDRELGVRRVDLKKLRNLFERAIEAAEDALGERDLKRRIDDEIRSLQAEYAALNPGKK